MQQVSRICLEDSARSTSPTPHEIHFFQEEGYLIVPDFLERSVIKEIADLFVPIFSGDYPTTCPPDEARWFLGKGDPEDVTRMIWNGWKSDQKLARVVLNEQIAKFAAILSGWNDIRINQEGLLWKPPGANGLAYHQDGSYNQWVNPVELVTCWIALDAVNEETGTIEYVPGSHKWNGEHKAKDFHAPQDFRSSVKQAAAANHVNPEYVSVAIPQGGAAFHSTWTWHGSGPNVSLQDRKALALHLMRGEAEFQPGKPAYAQERYRLFGSNFMSESFYPVLWASPDSNVQRSEQFIDFFLKSPRKAYRTFRHKKVF